MNFLMTRGQRSKLHVAMQDALDIPPELTFETEYLRKAAFLEAVCWCDDHAEVFLLANQIESFILAALWDAKEEFAHVDFEDLCGQYDRKTLSIALRIAGVRPKMIGLKTVYTTAPGEEAALFVKLPFDLLDK